QPPGVVTLDDCPRDDLARHRRSVETVSAEPAGEPHLRRQLADLRHAVERVTQYARPDMLDRDPAELRIDALDIGLEPRHEAVRIGLPGGHPARPHQPVAADAAVMVV